MKKVLWLASLFVLLLAPAVLAEPSPAAAAESALFPGGDCAGANATAVADASGNAGLEELELFAPVAQSMQPPMCPTTSICPAACPPAMICLVGNLGQCCTGPGGLLRCCPSGQTIQVKSCACTGCPGLRQLTLSCV